jgi:hypothetical protein
MDQGQSHNYGIKYQTVWLVVCFVEVVDSNPVVGVVVDSNLVEVVVVDSNPVVEVAVVAVAVAVDSNLVEVEVLVVELALG